MVFTDYRLPFCKYTASKIKGTLFNQHIASIQLNFCDIDRVS